MKKIPLHWSIMLGMILGVLVGAVFTTFETGPKLISHWVKPFGTIFINGLKLIAMPLILGSLIKGVSDLKDISKLSQMGGRTIGIYIMTTVVAVMIGLIMVNTVKPGSIISEETRQELLEAYQSDAEEKQAVAQKQKMPAPFKHWLIWFPIIFLRPHRKWQYVASHLFCFVFRDRVDSYSRRKIKARKRFFRCLQ